MIQKYLFILGTVIRLCYSQTRVFINIPNCVGLYRTCLPPANEVCEGYVFKGVCLSTGGVPGQVPPRQVPAWQVHPWQVPPWQVHPPGQVPPRQVHPRQVPPQVGTPWAGTPPGAGTPPEQVPPRNVYPPRHVQPPWASTPPRTQYMLGTVNKRAVRIPLECILVLI